MSSTSPTDHVNSPPPGAGKVKVVSKKAASPVGFTFAGSARSQTSHNRSMLQWCSQKIGSSPAV